MPTFLIRNIEDLYLQYNDYILEFISLARKEMFLISIHKVELRGFNLFPISECKSKLFF